ncbi:unnamed protein product, partial [Iphiclides podalirius]
MICFRFRESLTPDTKCEQFSITYSLLIGRDIDSDEPAHSASNTFSVTSASPKWKVFKKIEKIGRNVRDGIIKAGPAVQVVGQASQVYKQG